MFKKLFFFGLHVWISTFDVGHLDLKHFYSILYGILAVWFGSVEARAGLAKIKNQFLFSVKWLTWSDFMLSNP